MDETDHCENIETSEDNKTTFRSIIEKADVDEAIQKVHDLIDKYMTTRNETRLKTIKAKRDIVIQTEKNRSKRALIAITGMLLAVLGCFILTYWNYIPSEALIFIVGTAIGTLLTYAINVENSITVPDMDYLCEDDEL